MTGKKKPDHTPASSKRPTKQPRLSAHALARHNGSAIGSAGSAVPAASVAPSRMNAVAKCLDCDAVPSATSKFPAGVTDACLLHWELYCGGFTTYGSWKEFISQKEKDTTIQQAWDNAEESKKSGEKQWLPTEVLQTRCYSCDVAKSMAGPSRSQLKHMLSISPERMGVKMQDLVDVNNTPYKGLLIPNPARPFTEFNFTKRVGVDKSTRAMSSGDQMYEQHADVVSEYVKAELMKEKEVKDAAVKMRTSPWDLADLVKKSCEVRGVPVDPVNCSPMAAMLMGEFGTLYAGGDRKTVALASRGAGPQDVANLNDKVARTARSGVACEDAASAISPSAVGKGGSASKRVPIEDGLPVTDADRDDLVHRRISAYSIEKIMLNENMGRERRWCSDSRDLFQRKGDNRADALQKHLDLAKHAENLVGGSISEMDIGMLETTVKELQDGGVFIPSSYDASKFLASIVPWVGPEKVFDGNKPQLCLLGCSTDEKIGHFVFTAVVKLGESGKQGVMDISDKCLSYCALIVDRGDCDDFDKTVTDVELTSKALKALVLATFVPGYADLNRMIALAASKDRSGLLGHMLTQMANVITRCRTGTFEHLVELLTESLEEFIRSLKIANPNTADGDAYKKLVLAEQCLKQAQVVLPQNIEIWESHIRAVETYMTLIGKADYANTFVEVLGGNAQLESGNLSMDAVRKVDRALKDAIQAGSEIEVPAMDKLEKFIEADNNDVSSIRYLVEVAFGYARETPDATPESLDPILQLATAVKDMPVTESRQTLSASLDRFIHAMTAWSATLSSLAKFEAGGPDLASRISAVNSFVEIKALLSDRALLLHRVGDGPAPCKAMGAFIEMLDKTVGDLKAEYLKGVTTVMQTANEKLRGSADGGHGDERASWTDRIPEGKANDFDVVRSIFTDAIAGIDGNLFSMKLNALQKSQMEVQVAYNLFSECVPDELFKEPSQTVRLASVTRATAKALHSWDAYSKDQNDVRLKRELRKILKTLTDHELGNIVGGMQPAVRKWAYEK
ncbi:unnamed protein product, partial [Prorocentrum cordatum]